MGKVNIEENIYSETAWFKLKGWLIIWVIEPIYKIKVENRKYDTENYSILKC